MPPFGTLAQVLDLPEVDSTYPGVSVSSSATVNTFGSWVELVADVGVGKRLVTVVIAIDSVTTNLAHAEVEIGEGAAGDEAAVTRFPFEFDLRGTIGSQPSISVSVWHTLTNNARLSVRIKDSKAEAAGYGAAVMIV